MTAPVAVDVLAVMDEVIATYEHMDWTNIRQREARAAVAELIEAHKALLDYTLSEAAARQFDPPADTRIVADSMASLARIGGAP